MSVGSQTEKPKIALLVPNLASFGGSVVVGRALAQELSTSYDPLLISYVAYDPKKNPVERSLTCESLDLNWDMRLLEAWKRSQGKLHAILKKHGCQLLMALGTSETFVSVLPARRLGIPLIYCDHGSLFSHWSSSRKWKIVNKINARAAAHIVSLTQVNAQAYRDLLKVPQERISQIPNWADEELLASSLAESKEDHHARMMHRRILWFGRLSQEKGVDRLFEIAKRCLPQHPDWQIDVVGNAFTSKEFEAYRREAASLNLGSQLQLLGYSPHKEQVYRDHSIVILTSYHEGLPLTLLEGAAMGMPSVSYDVLTGPRDIIDEGVSGFLVEPGDVQTFSDKLGQLICSDELREKMGREARRIAHDHYGKEQIIARWFELVGRFVKPAAGLQQALHSQVRGLR